jgi:multidrug efflux pump subunit AcrA (membrane-fusion protein)
MAADTPQQGARIGILGAFLVMVSLALGFRILSTASIKGVVNAPILLIQSPIDGTVTLVGLKAGQTIKKGENIFQIENERLDTSDLDRLRSEIDQAQAAIEALEVLVQDLSKLPRLLGVHSLPGQSKLENP